MIKERFTVHITTLEFKLVRWGRFARFCRLVFGADVRDQHYSPSQNHRCSCCCFSTAVAAATTTTTTTTASISDIY